MKRTLYDSLVMLIDNIGHLLCVKTAISFAVIAVLCYGFVCDKVSSEVFIGVVSSVITYFFTRKANDAEVGK